MTATIEIDERNGAPAGVETEVTDDFKFGDDDAYNLVPTDYPVTAGNNTYEKWVRLQVTALGGLTNVKNFKVWKSGGDALGSNTSLKTNARTTGYGGAEVYAQPIKTASTVATQDMPTSEPATANLGIGGSLTGTITSVPTYTDYLIMQFQTTASETTGKTITLTFAWEETP